jgi:hypothetical protein
MNFVKNCRESKPLNKETPIGLREIKMGKKYQWLSAKVELRIMTPSRGNILMAVYLLEKSCCPVRKQTNEKYQQITTGFKTR